MLQSVRFQIPSPIFTSLLLVLMVQKTHGREIQYLKQEGLLPQGRGAAPARVCHSWQRHRHRDRALAAAGGWELHHAANDRIITK